jgi:hypothetical protein
VGDGVERLAGFFVDKKVRLEDATSFGFFRSDDWQ